LKVPRYVAFGPLLAFGVFAAQCSREPKRALPLRIGEVASLSGVLAAQGTAVHEGVVYAVSEVNAAGGLGGNPVELITRDDGGRPDEATTAAQDLTTRERVSALVGGYVDSIVGPVAQLAERERVPYVAGSSLDQRLTQRGNAWFFRISRLEPFVDAATAVPLELLPAKDVAILFSATPGATQLARLQKERLEAYGVRVSAFESFQTGTPDFIPLLARVKASGARLLRMDGHLPDAERTTRPSLSSREGRWKNDRAEVVSERRRRFRLAARPYFWNQYWRARSRSRSATCRLRCAIS
jgi:branched-chain amino acid transport system substrate-binding protein